MEKEIPPLAADIAVNGHDLLTVPAQIGGKEEILASTFDVSSPFTGEKVWKASDASPEDAIRAVNAAKAALPGWSATHPKERQRILLKSADILFERCEEIAALWRSETGANYSMTSTFATPLTCDFIRAYANKATNIHGVAPCTDTPGQSSIVQKVPIGVVLGVVPWNAPPAFAPRVIAAPLAAGCTVVVKASDLSPRTYYALAKCYIDAGVPAGAINVLTCHADKAAQLVTTIIEQPAIRKIHFTGSTNVGRRIASTAALNLKPVILELGGKGSAIVLDDANLETAAVQIILGAFLNSGQICQSTDRVLVSSKIAPQFEAVFSAVLGNMFNSGNAPAALVSAASKERIEALIAEAKSKGAESVNGDWVAKDGTEPTIQGGKYEKGVFTRPVVLKNVNSQMKIYSEEIFGLVVTLITVESEEEAIRIANDTGYGLSSSVFTEDLRKGLRIAKEIESGQVNINFMTVNEAPEMPFGGIKDSGWGRVNAMAGVEEYLVTKGVLWMD